MSFYQTKYLNFIGLSTEFYRGKRKKNLISFFVDCRHRRIREKGLDKEKTGWREWLESSITPLTSPRSLRRAPWRRRQTCLSAMPCQLKFFLHLTFSLNVGVPLESPPTYVPLWVNNRLFLLNFLLNSSLSAIATTRRCGAEKKWDWKKSWKGGQFWVRAFQPFYSGFQDSNDQSFISFRFLLGA